MLAFLKCAALNFSTDHLVQLLAGVSLGFGRTFDLLVESEPLVCELQCTSPREIRRFIWVRSREVSEKVREMRLPRLPALHARKKKWRLPEQSDPFDCQEEKSSTERIWRRNCASVSEFTDKVLAVMEDLAERGQVLKYTEQEAGIPWGHQEGQAWESRNSPSLVRWHP